MACVNFYLYSAQELISGFYTFMSLYISYSFVFWMSLVLEKRFPVSAVILQSVACHSAQPGIRVIELLSGFLESTREGSVD